MEKHIHPKLPAEPITAKKFISGEKKKLKSNDFRFSCVHVSNESLGPVINFFREEKDWIDGNIVITPVTLTDEAKKEYGNYRYAMFVYCNHKHVKRRTEKFFMKWFHLKPEWVVAF